MSNQKKKPTTSEDSVPSVTVAPGGSATICDGMRARHSPEPWEVYDEFGIIGIHAGDLGVALMDNEDESPEEYERADANADRIVVCVNACAGIPVEALEAGVLPAALDVAVAAFRSGRFRAGGLEMLGAALRALGRLP